MRYIRLQAGEMIDGVLRMLTCEDTYIRFETRNVAYLVLRTWFLMAHIDGLSACMTAAAVRE